MFREWIYECGQTKTFSTTTCVTKDCTTPDGSMLLFPHCTKAKDLRDAGGLRREDASGNYMPGADDVKYLVTSDGTTAAAWDAPIADTYVPPEKFLVYLDQFVADSALGSALFASEIVWANNATVRDAAAVAEGLRNTRLRATYKAADKADEQIESMVDLRAAINEVGVTGAFPYMARRAPSPALEPREGRAGGPCVPALCSRRC